MSQMEPTLINILLPIVKVNILYITYLLYAINMLTALLDIIILDIECIEFNSNLLYIVFI